MTAMLDRLFIFALSAYLALAPVQAFASQNSLLSPTTGTVSGLQLTNNYNNALDSVNTMNSGASAPTNQLTGTPSAFNRWCNTTANPFPCNVYDGAQWLAPYYVDATNHLILNQVGGGTATLASATTTSICTDPQYFITISGSVTITGLGTGCFVGQAKKIAFSGALTFTNNNTSLILPSGANIITAAGDAADAVYLGSGNWQITNYQPANGQAVINAAIDVGAVEWTFSPNIPSAKYLWGFGQAVSRSTYAGLLTALTITQSVTSTNGSPTLTGFSDTTQIGPGAVVEASFLAAPAIVVSCTATTCTLNANANASTTANAVVFPYGDGNASTTFNLPDCRDVAFVGRDNMGGTARGLLTKAFYGNYGQTPEALGSLGGLQGQTLTGGSGGNIPQYIFTPTGTVSVSPGTVVVSVGTGIFNGGASAALNSASTSSTGAAFTGNPISIGNGSPAPIETIQPSLTLNCMIRVLAKLRPLIPTAEQFAANGNEMPVGDRRRIA